jgi:glucosamine kinase
VTFVIGVDGGGTHARAVIADDSGAEIARGEAPGAVVTLLDPGAAASAVTAAVRAAAERAGLTLPGAFLWAGLAGAGHERSRAAVEGALTRAGLARAVRVGTDAEAAFHAAFEGRPGVMLIAGTGSVAWARGPAGRVRVGGWGQQLGDEGSGYAIGLAALRAAVHAEDGRSAPTRILPCLLSELGLDDPMELIPWAAAASKAEYAALVPLVARAADEGDAAARRILDDAIHDLEAHVMAILRRSGPWTTRPGLLLYGGLVAPGGTLREALLARLESHPVEVRPGEVDAAAGAAMLAVAALRGDPPSA